jgi:hypothetical protein
MNKYEFFYKELKSKNLTEISFFTEKSVNFIYHHVAGERLTRSPYFFQIKNSAD